MCGQALDATCDALAGNVVDDLAEPMAQLQTHELMLSNLLPFKGQRPTQIGKAAGADAKHRP